MKGVHVPDHIKAQVRALLNELNIKSKDGGVAQFTTFGPAISAIDRAITKELKKRWNLNHSEYIVLHSLVDHSGSVTLSQMNKQLLFSRQALATTARALEKRGLIIREGMKSDRRKIRISLTQEGFDYIRTILISPHRKMFISVLVTFLAEDEVNSLLGTFEKMVKGLRLKNMF